MASGGDRRPSMPAVPHVTATARLGQGPPPISSMVDGPLLGGSRSSVFVAKFERAVFGVLHVMKREQGGDSNASKLTAYVLQFIDFLQVRLGRAQ